MKLTLNIPESLSEVTLNQYKQGNSLQKPNPMTGDHAIDAVRYAMMMELENPNRGTYHLY